jgi:RNase P subunit RPR2
MSTLGRETIQYIKEFIDLTRRGVEALERLNDEVKIDVEMGAPICPHCGVENPQVRIMESQSSGPLADVVIRAECMECGEILYAVIESYSMHRTTDTVRDELFYSRRAGNAKSSL